MQNLFKKNKFEGMADTRLNKSLIIYLAVINISCLITIFLRQVHNSILPKFISSSYKEYLSMNFHSDLLNSVYESRSSYFKTSSHINLLIGDLPISNNSKIVRDFLKSTDSNLYDQNIINDLKKNPNFLEKIPINNNNENDKNEYFLFPDLNKTKMNIVVISLEKNNTNESINYCFTKTSIVTLYEIPIENFIIDFQEEFNLDSSFFKLKTKIYIPGIIIKSAFSNDYNFLIVLYKQVYNGINLKYKIVYIDIYNVKYDTIDIPGSVKVSALSVMENLIVYSRKLDIYNFNFLYKSKTSKKWECFSKEKKNYNLQPYNIISDLKFISKTKNSTIEKFLLVKGVYSNDNGVKLFIKLIKLNLNSLITNETMNFFSNSKTVINQYLEPNLFEKDDFDLFENNYTYNMDSLETDKFNERLKKINSPLVMNKYVQGNINDIFLYLQFLSNSTYKILFMGDNFFSNNDNLTFDEDNYIKKISKDEVLKICGKNDLFVFQYSSNSLFFVTTLKNFTKTDRNVFFDERRISFISLPNDFKFSKIYDFYFDKFNEKILLFLLIDNGVLVSLDFSQSISHKNNIKTFLCEGLNTQKSIMLVVDCFLFFLFFLDWSKVDNISLRIRNYAIGILYIIIYKIFNRMGNFQPNNQRNENRDLHLSFSNLSINSIYSNDVEASNEEEINMGNSNENFNVQNNLEARRNRREERNNNPNNNNNIFEDVLENDIYFSLF